MHKPVKYVEKAVTVAATGVWAVFERLNRIKPNPSPTPKWSDKPLLKSYEKSKPPLGWPRTTDSLCPKCVPEIRQQIPDGELLHGEIWPRFRAHGGPDEPLQHDVRPLLHGRKPGRLRPRIELGRHQDGARQRGHHQAPAPDVGAVLRRRAYVVALLPRCGALR